MGPFDIERLEILEEHEDTLPELIDVFQRWHAIEYGYVLELTSYLDDAHRCSSCRVVTSFGLVNGGVVLYGCELSADSEQDLRASDFQESFPQEVLSWTEEVWTQKKADAEKLRATEKARKKLQELQEASRQRQREHQELLDTLAKQAEAKEKKLEAVAAAEEALKAFLAENPELALQEALS